MKIKRNSAWLAAAVCAALMTGCGDHSSVTGAADAGSRTSRSSTAETTTVTDTGTTASLTDSSTAETTGAAQSTGSSEHTTEKSLKDRAESALDSVGDAVTSLLTEATRPR